MRCQRWKSTAALAAALVLAAMPGAGQQVTSVEMTAYEADRATYGSWAPTAVDLLIELVRSVQATGGDIRGSLRMQAKPGETRSSRGSVSADFRQAADETPAKVRERVEAHLREQKFHLVAEEPDLETRRSHPRIACLTWNTDSAPGVGPGASTPNPCGPKVAAVEQTPPGAAVAPRGMVVIPREMMAVPLEKIVIPRVWPSYPWVSSPYPQDGGRTQADDRHPRG